MIVGPVKFYKSWTEPTTDTWANRTDYGYIGIGDRLGSLISDRYKNDGSSYPLSSEEETLLTTTFKNVMFTSFSNSVYVDASCPGIKAQNGALLYRVANKRYKATKNKEVNSYEFGINSAGHPYLVKGSYTTGSFSDNIAGFKNTAQAIATDVTLSTGVHYNITFYTRYTITGSDEEDGKSYTYVTVTNASTGTVVKKNAPMYVTESLASNTVTSSMYIGKWETNWDSGYTLAIGQKEVQFYSDINICGYDMVPGSDCKYSWKKVSIKGYRDTLKITGINNNIQLDTDFVIRFEHDNEDYNSGGGSFFPQWATDSNYKIGTSSGERCLNSDWLNTSTITITFNNLITAPLPARITNNITPFKTSNNISWSCAIPSGAKISLPNPLFEEQYNSDSFVIGAKDLMFVGYRLSNTAEADIYNFSELNNALTASSFDSNIIIYSTFFGFKITSKDNPEGTTTPQGAVITRTAVASGYTEVGSGMSANGKIYYDSITDLENIPTTISWQSQGTFPTAVTNTSTLPVIEVFDGKVYYLLKFTFNGYEKKSIETPLAYMAIANSAANVVKTGGAIFIYHDGAWRQIFGESISTNSYDFLGVVFG